MNEWITVKAAARIIGQPVASLSQKVYEKKFKAIRIGGIIFCEKASVVAYAEDRNKRIAAQEQKSQEADAKKSESAKKRELAKLMQNLSPEQVAELLKQFESKV